MIEEDLDMIEGIEGIEVWMEDDKTSDEGREGIILGRSVAGVKEKTRT